ncbi:hypothetical protein PILCRDRAFT_89583 [Piloderma croceum F 1598]|uniref:Uncharacterized protein n=1 Tax=Piloderma croceum (strain F 1598) TaxID=765440 RepID=A0A0C3B376_PILCF|nr:hypothetical protein PILCRDRAFT_89583 [Piloderma croceum F 1598]
MRSPEVVTYSLKGSKMVYQAIDFVQKEFGDELGQIERNHISFSVHMFANGTNKLRSVRIGVKAWPAVISHLKTFEIIDVHVQPEGCMEHADGPPGYHEVKEEEGKCVTYSIPGDILKMAVDYSASKKGKPKKLWFRC